jgi:hypothetical protein
MERLTEILSTRVTQHTYDLVCRLARERRCEISELLRDLVDAAAAESDARARAVTRAVEMSATPVP